MTNLKRKISTVACATVLALTMSTVASAVTTTTETTSGGTGGKVTIRSRIFSDERQPTGTVNIATYKVTSDIPAESTLKTNFDIQATLTNSNSSHNFSESGYANSVTAQTSDSGPHVVFYDYLQSTTTTNSTAYGKSTQQCNGPV